MTREFFFKHLGFSSIAVRGLDGNKINYYTPCRKSMEKEVNIIMLQFVEGLEETLVTLVMAQ